MAQPPPGQGKGQGQGGPGAGQRTSTSGSTPAAAPRSTTGAAVPRAPTSGSVPAARSPTGEQPVRRSPTLSGLPNARAGVAAFELGGTTDSKSYKKGINQSAFTGEEERTQVDALLGGRRPARPPEDESTSVGKTFDGVVRQVRNAPTTVSGVVTYTTVVDVENKDKTLRPGMTSQQGREAGIDGEQGMGYGDAVGAVADLADLEALEAQLGQDYAGSTLDDVDVDALERQLAPSAVADLRALAQADLDLRGAKDLPESLVMEVLVARLSKLVGGRR